MIMIMVVVVAGKNRRWKKNYFKIPSLKEKNNSISMIFESNNQKIKNCKLYDEKTDVFSFIENNFYMKYLFLKKQKIIFLLNGDKINTNLTLEGNKIKDNDKILFVHFDVNDNIDDKNDLKTKKTNIGNKITIIFDSTAEK